MIYLKKILTISLLLLLTNLFLGCKEDVSLSSINTMPTEKPDKMDEEDFNILKEKLEDIEEDSEDLTDQEIEDENNESEIEEELNQNEETVITDQEGEEDEALTLEDEEMNCHKPGNIIKNGSFEITDSRKGIVSGKSLDSMTERGWDVFESLPSKEKDKPSWVTTEGAGIEIQEYKTVATPIHGKKSVELDSHGSRSNSTMSQEVSLCKGKYILKFLYYARTKNLDDNNIIVRLNDKIIKEVNLSYSGKWKLIRIAFKINRADNYKISFSASGKENSLGGLIDHIRLRKKIRRAGVVTSLLALGDKDNRVETVIKKEISDAIISKMINFASLKRKPFITLVKDHGHNGESIQDFDLVKEILLNKYGSDKLRIVEGDLHIKDAKDSDLIYVINPGYPLKSKTTAETLREIKKIKRIGIILSGDDISRGAGFSLEDITGVKYKNNGTQACGVRIDNNNTDTNYNVKLKRRHFRKLSKSERTLSYGNDIDHVQVSRKGLRILAKGDVKDCDIKIPVIFGYKLK